MERKDGEMTLDDYAKLIEKQMERHAERIKAEEKRLAAFEAELSAMYGVSDSGDESEGAPTPNAIDIDAGVKIYDGGWSWTMPVKSIEEVFPAPEVKVETAEERNARMWQAIQEASRG